MNDFIGLCLQKSPKSRPCAGKLLDNPSLLPFLRGKSSAQGDNSSENNKENM
jgi:hypothetical protein